MRVAIATRIKVTDIQQWVFNLPSMGLALHETDAQFFLLRKGKFLVAKNKVLAQFPCTAKVVPQRISMLIVVSNLHLLDL